MSKSHPTRVHLPSVLRLVLVIVAATISGVMNAIVGGGTLLTSPALVGLGIPPIVANATSTVALWPALVSSILGYRDELGGALPWAGAFGLPSLLGGAAGALLLLHTSPERFSAPVPWLVLGATALFVAQEPVMRAIRSRREKTGSPRRAILGSMLAERLSRSRTRAARRRCRRFSYFAFGSSFRSMVGISVPGSAFSCSPPWVSWD